MAALIALLVVLTALGFCLAPVFGAQARAAGPDPIEALEAERARLLAAIRDADLDLAMGKIAAADHADMRRSLEADAVSVLARLESIRAAGAGSSGTRE